MARLSQSMLSGPRDPYGRDNIWIARREEQRAIQALLGATARVVFVQGKRGSGKSAFVHHVWRSLAEKYAAITSIGPNDIGLRDITIPLVLALAQRSNGTPLPFDLPSGRFLIPKGGRVLLAIDDAHLISQPRLAKFLRGMERYERDDLRILITSEATVPRLPKGTATFELRWSGDELLELVTKRAALAGLRTNLAIQYFNELRDTGAQYEELTPRFVLQFVNSRMQGESLENSLLQVRRAYFKSVSHLLISHAEERSVVVPGAIQPAIELNTSVNSPLLLVPYIFVQSARYHWAAEIEELEALINERSVPERALQNFFERNPQFLCGLDYKKAVPQVVLTHVTGRTLIPDFLLQPIDSQFADIFELKRPSEKIIVGSENRLHYSQAVHEALAQVREYRDYFEMTEHRRAVLDKYGLTAYKPDSVVIIGRTPTDVSLEALRRAFENAPPYARVMTYDQMLARMRRMSDLFWT